MFYKYNLDAINNELKKRTCGQRMSKFVPKKQLTMLTMKELHTSGNMYI